MTSMPLVDQLFLKRFKHKTIKVQVQKTYQSLVTLAGLVLLFLLCNSLSLLAQDPLVIDDTGKVSIGTNFPVGKLTVLDTSRNSITIKTSLNSKSNGIAFQNSGSAYSWNSFRADAVTPASQAHLIFSGGVPNSNLLGLPERMRITNTGNVGIGTPTPGNYRLNVGGPLNASSATFGQGAATPENGVLLTLNSQRAWQFRQSKTGPSTGLELINTVDGGAKNLFFTTSGTVQIRGQVDQGTNKGRLEIDGALKANNANINGRATITELKIGSWTIKDVNGELVFIKGSQKIVFNGSTGIKVGGNKLIKENDVVKIGYKDKNSWLKRTTVGDGSHPIGWQYWGYFNSSSYTKLIIDVID